MYTKIKASRLQAMKEKNEVAKSFYSTFLGEIETEAKKEGVELNDALIEQIAKSMAKNIQFNIKTYSEQGQDTSKEEQELAIVNLYLPQVFSDEKTREVVSEAITEAGVTSLKEQGKIMGPLKQKYGNSINMKLVSQIVREILQ